MDIKIVYLNEMTSIKDNIYYSENCIKAYRFWDKVIHIVIGISSAASIGSWVIWKNYSNIWASFVAIAQLLIVIKPFFSYTELISQYKNYIDKATELFNKFDNYLYYVLLDNTSEEEINNKLSELRKEATKIEKSTINIHTFDCKWRAKRAQKKTEDFMLKYGFDVGEESNE